ncbi:MAG: zinc ribbon domain-containing protein [Thermoplasmata archaeon]
MTKICPLCGSTNEDDAQTCVKCGYIFNQKLNLPSYDQQLYTDNSEVNPLIYKVGYLRRAFFILIIGTILLILPITNFIGIIMFYIGLFFLAKGFDKISKTSLRYKSYYRRTRIWLIALLIFSVFMYVLEQFGLNYNSIVSVVMNSKGTYNSDIWMNLGTVIMMVAINTIVYALAYLKLIKSLRLLSEELQVKRLHKAGNYLLFSLIPYIISVVLFPILLLLILRPGSPLSPDLGASKFTLFLEWVALPAFIIVIAYIVQILGYSYAYRGIDEFVYLSS